MNRDVLQQAIDAFEWTNCYVPNHAESKKMSLEAIKALRAELAKPDGWQPIETAPKDGTLLLVYESRCSGFAVMYLNGWKYESGAICYLEPTHWMPLPASPSTHNN